MSLVSIVDALAGKPGEGEVVTVQGWVRTRRDSKAGLSFVNVHDGSCFNPIQAVVDNNVNNYESEVIKLTTGCSVRITGTLVPSQGKGQTFEIQATEVEVLGWVDDPDTYPMPMKRHTVEHLRKHAHLRPRTNLISAVTRVRNCLAQAIHRFMHGKRL